MKRTVWLLLAILFVPLARSAADTNDYWEPIYAPGDDRARMKRLDEIEPRMAIDALPAYLDQSGSYYVTRNLEAGPEVTNGIVIAASDVALDLGGFALSGTTGAWFGVCLETGTYRNITVANGVVRGWGRGGVVMSDGVNCRIREVTVSANGQFGSHAGLAVGQDWDVERCFAFANGNHGIAIGNNSTVRGSKARSNGGYGIVAGDAAVIDQCAATGNGQYGIYGGMRNMIRNCMAIANTNTGIYSGLYSLATDNITADNAGVGIEAGTGSLVQRNVVANNQGGGIRAAGWSRVFENQVVSNGGEAIYAQVASRVERNHVFGHSVGIRAAPGANGVLVVGNSAVGNTTNYVVSETAIWGQTVSTNELMPSTNFYLGNPWANFDLPY